MANYIYNGQFYYYDGHELLNRPTGLLNRQTGLLNRLLASATTLGKATSGKPNNPFTPIDGIVNSMKEIDRIIVHDTTVSAAVQAAHAARAHADRASSYVAQLSYHI